MLRRGRYPWDVSSYPGSEREGKGAIIAGVAAIAAGVVVQALNVYSFATQAPPQFGSTGDFGTAALVSGIAWLLIMSGVVLTIVGIVRYAQSGGHGVSVSAPGLVGHPAGTAGRHAGAAGASASLSTQAFCSSCGARLLGEGRYCSACGTPAAR